MTDREIVALVEEYQSECEGAEYDYLDERHLLDFLMRKISKIHESA